MNVTISMENMPATNENAKKFFMEVVPEDQRRLIYFAYALGKLGTKYNIPENEITEIIKNSELAAIGKIENL